MKRLRPVVLCFHRHFFFQTFSMALYHKWDVKNDFAYVLQFFSLISDSLGSVISFMVALVYYITMLIS